MLLFYDRVISRFLKALLDTKSAKVKVNQYFNPSHIYKSKDLEKQQKCLTKLRFFLNFNFFR